MNDEVEKVDDEDDATIVFPDGVEHSGLYGRPNLHEQLVALVTAWAEQVNPDEYICRNEKHLLDLAIDLGLSELTKGETRDKKQQCLHRLLAMHDCQAIGGWRLKICGSEMFALERGLGIFKYEYEAGILENLFEHGFELLAVQIRQDFSEMRHALPRYLDVTVIVSWWRWLLYSLPLYKNRIMEIVAGNRSDTFIYRVKISCKRDRAKR